MKKRDLIVFYDGWCPLCQKAKVNIEKTDTKQKRIELLSFRDPKIFETFKLDGKNVENRIYSVDKETSKSFSGIHTILQIAKRIPRYKIMVPFIYISILLGFGQKLYDYIASKRNIVPVGHCNDESCPIHGEKGGDEHPH